MRLLERINASQDAQFVAGLHIDLDKRLPSHEWLVIDLILLIHTANTGAVSINTTLPVAVVVMLATTITTIQKLGFGG